VKNGTPGFIGERLRQGREARTLTITALAEVLGVSKAAVSQYENGTQSPRPEVMRRIELVLNLPLLFFLRPARDKSDSPIFYRSRASATKTQRMRAENRHGWWKEIVDYLRRFATFPKPDIPNFDLPKNPNDISNEQIESLAQQTREYWRLGDAPISNCCWLLETKGAIVTRGHLGSETLDSFSEWDDITDTPFVFLGAEKTSAVRGRLNAIHELAHLIIHSRMSNLSDTDHDLRERQASEFAGAFLLPARTFARDMHAPTLDSFYRLKPKWKVAIGAMIKRAENLGFISDGEIKRMWIALARKGWRVHEPYDDELEVEEPKVCKNAIDLLISESIITKADIIDQGFASQDDIEALMCLPEGYLTQTTEPACAPIVQLKDRQRNVVAAPKVVSGKVVQFRERTSDR
jgi:Zn-dependent peptidase ImmA (M78 family)/transcriptional regulator with XRE-family HTH domain